LNTKQKIQFVLKNGWRARVAGEPMTSFHWRATSCWNCGGL